MSSHLIQRGSLAESRNVFVGGLPVAAPSVVGACDSGDVDVRQDLVSAVFHLAEISGVDEEDLAPPVAERLPFLPEAIGLVPGQEPERDSIWVLRKS